MYVCMYVCMYVYMYALLSSKQLLPHTITHIV